MSDLKEFLDNEWQWAKRYTRAGGNPSKENITDIICGKKDMYRVFIFDLGLFFWERGGKQFVNDCENDVKQSYCDTPSGKLFLKDKTEFEKYLHCANIYVGSESKDFLDCLACLGEDKIKELIEKGRCLKNE
jgi:glycosyltransferase involved in cell wall biosynthesis